MPMSSAKVLLANCHLAISWLATLEMIVQQFNPEQVTEALGAQQGVLEFY